MRVLWLCNIVLPDFSDFYGFKKNPVGGWMTGMFNEIKDKIELAFCFPIINPDFIKDGVYSGHRIYSFQFHQYDYATDVENRFCDILNDYNPDVIHIWGTEYPHTLAMINASKRCEKIDNTIINIQGLPSFIERYYADGVPEKYIDINVSGYSTIRDDINDFHFRGILEQKAIKEAVHIIGRTDWDEACIKNINPDSNYHRCPEIMRSLFYDKQNTWTYDSCCKHSIFVSQASYPVKGLHYLLKILPNIIKKFPDTHLYIGGKNILAPDDSGNISPYAVYIKDIIAENQLSEYITFLGSLTEEQMVEQYQKCNVFVSASNIENSSNSVCEAQMIGCPVISSNTGGICSIWKEAPYSYTYQYNAEYMLGYYIEKVFMEKNIIPNADYINSDIAGEKIMSIYQKICDIYRE